MVVRRLLWLRVPALVRHKVQARFPRLTHAVLGLSGPLPTYARPAPRFPTPPPGADLSVLAPLQRDRAPVDGEPRAVVHVYYLELLDELLDAVERAGIARVVVTTPHDCVDAVLAKAARRSLPIEVEGHENRGRDLLPFLRVASRLHEEGVGVIVKIHTKSSPHRAEGPSWREELVHRLLAPARVPVIVRAFSANPQLGCVGPEGHLLPFGPYWGWNEDVTRALASRMHAVQPRDDERFIAGSMFWLRLAALGPLWRAAIAAWEFEPEGGHIDGTFAHAVERAIAISVRASGHTLESAAKVCSEAEPREGSYEFALRR